MSNKLKTSIAGEEMTQHIAALHVIQDVGSHHRFEIHLSTEDRSGRFKGSLSDVSKKWIGQQMTIFDDDDMFLFVGVVTSVNLSRTRSAETEYVIKGNSNTIYLEDGVNMRSFGEKTLKQIVDEVMKPYQKKFTLFENKPKQGKIKYCVQYRESNFAFLNRLAARYGEWFYCDGDVLVFGKPTTSNTVELSFLRDITHFNISVRTTPVNFSLKAYDYKKHDTPNKQSNYASPSNTYAKIALDKSKTDLYPNSASVPVNLSMNEEDLDQIKTLRQNVHITELVVLSGSSTNKKLALGTVIKLVDTRDELDASGSDDYGEYIIIHVTHQITEQGSIYTNHFEAIPKDAAIPPLSISPDPPPCEMQTAEVVENNDPKGMGRVRVQFIWQKELSGNDSKTPWIRVASPQGGGSKGFYILPEKEDQVLVAFDHNHPERPFVLTGMYHGKAKPEPSHPENYKKVLKTKGGNEIMLDDEKGKESIKIKSPKDIVINAAAGKITLTAKGDVIIQSSSGNVTISAPSSIKLEATDIVLEGKKSVSIKTLEMKVKADVSVDIEAVLIGIKADASASLKGAMVEVNGSGMTNIQGGMIKLN